MKIKCGDMNGVAIIAISGEMYGGPENTKLVEILDDLGREGKLETIVDLEKVTHIASNGLGILLRARARYLKHGGRLSLCGANSRVLDILRATKIHLMFDLYDTSREALTATRR